jgi:hypothetical protein
LGRAAVIPVALEYLACPYLATILITLFLTVPAMSVELFRYRGAAKDGGTLEYVFEAGEQNSPNAITKEKVAEIAADFMTTFYHEQVGALETQEFRTTPVPFWLVCFRTRSKDLCGKCLLSCCCLMGRLLCRKWRNGSSQWRDAVPGGKVAYRSSEKRPATHPSYSTKWFLSLTIADGPKTTTG